MACDIVTRQESVMKSLEVVQHHCSSFLHSVVP